MHRRHWCFANVLNVTGWDESCAQIYANPIYELLDTKLGDFNASTWSAKNTLVRIISRGCVG